jgi:3-dehydroquinate synthase
MVSGASPASLAGTAGPRPGSTLAAAPRLRDASIVIETGTLDAIGVHVRRAAPAHRYAIITDDRVGPIYAARAAAALAAAGSGRVDVLTVPAGEHTKTRSSWADLTDQLVARGCGRDTTIIALGGGVVGDLAGFVAATFLRGVPVVQVPTTLLAMIDAAIGGKTGVDTSAGKNLVGAFHPPAAVLIDPAVLATLPPRHLRAGAAEAIKHGVVANASYFERTVTDLPRIMAAHGEIGPAMGVLIDGSVEIKNAVVAADERESGVRKILNFGHTIGHAVEAASGYSILHGEAVAIGMAVESHLAELAGIAVCGLTDRVCAALEAAGLSSVVPPAFDASDLVARTHLDKKARGGAVEYALPTSLGQMAGADTGWTIALPDRFVMEALG